MQPRSNVIARIHTFDPVILREYDMRGQVGKNLTIHDAYILGRTFGTKMRHGGGQVCCVAYDGRLTSPALTENLIKGLNETGIHVTTLGLGPSPMLYFAVKHLKADAGIMVTGSHNPADYNGFKMSMQAGPVYGAAIQEIGKLAATGQFETGSATIKTLDIQNMYVERLLKDFTGTAAKKIAWDSGNGASGEILRRLVKKLPGEHILLFDEIDGRFPNHHPDPTVDKNLAELQRVVLEKGCDLGIAFDGDGDRIGVVDENGKILRCDTLMTIYARDVLQSHPGAPIIADVKCSQVLFDEIARLGGQPIMWKTGHSLIKAKMAELKAPLAGELSGHIFFADKYYGFDDALYCAIRLLNSLNDPAKPLSSLTAHLPRIYNTPELRIEVDEKEKFNLVHKVAASVQTQPNVHIDLTDGMRVITEDGWWLLRASNTQNVIVARVESATEDGLNRLANMAEAEIAKLGYSFSTKT